MKTYFIYHVKNNIYYQLFHDLLENLENNRRKENHDCGGLRRGHHQFLINNFIFS